MDMDDYSGPTVAVLVRVTLSGREVDSAYPDEDEAAYALGKDVLAGQVAPATAWEVHTVPAPLLVRRDVGQPVEHEPESVGDLDAIAATISHARTGRPWHEVRTTPGGAGDLEAARKVLAVVGQRMRDARDQRDADLAAALGMDEPQPWPTMCRKVRGLRQAEDERGTGGGALGPQLWAALEPTGISVGADEAAMVARVRDLVQNVRDGLTEDGRVRKLYRELRNALRPAQTDPTAVDRMTRGALLDLVRSVVEAANTPAVDPLADPDRATELRARLVRELDPAHAGNVDRLSAAADVILAADFPGHASSNEVATDVVDAYLREG